MLKPAVFEVPIIFRIHAPFASSRERVWLLGSMAELGEWNPNRAIETGQVESEWKVWQARVRMPVNTTFQWSWCTLASDGSVKQWESSQRRERQIFSFSGVLHTSWGDPSVEIFHQNMGSAHLMTERRTKKGDVVAVLGSSPSLGAWDPKNAVVTTEFPPRSGHWSVTVYYDSAALLEWNWIIIDKETKEVKLTEKRKTRFLYESHSWIKLHAPWNKTAQAVNWTVREHCGVGDPLLGTVEQLNIHRARHHEIRRWEERAELWRISGGIHPTTATLQLESAPVPKRAASPEPRLLDSPGLPFEWSATHKPDEIRESEPSSPKPLLPAVSEDWKPILRIKPYNDVTALPCAHGTQLVHSPFFPSGAPRSPMPKMPPAGKPGGGESPKTTPPGTPPRTMASPPKPAAGYQSPPTSSRQIPLSSQRPPVSPQKQMPPQQVAPPSKMQTPPQPSPPKAVVPQQPEALAKKPAPSPQPSPQKLPLPFPRPETKESSGSTVSHHRVVSKAEKQDASVSTMDVGPRKIIQPTQIREVRRPEKGTAEDLQAAVQAGRKAAADILREPTFTTPPPPGSTVGKTTVSQAAPSSSQTSKASKPSTPGVPVTKVSTESLGAVPGPVDITKVGYTPDPRCPVEGKGDRRNLVSDPGRPGLPQQAPDPACLTDVGEVAGPLMDHDRNTYAPQPGSTQSPDELPVPVSAAAFSSPPVRGNAIQVAEATKGKPDSSLGVRAGSNTSLASQVGILASTCEQPSLENLRALNEQREQARTTDRTREVMDREERNRSKFEESKQKEMAVEAQRKTSTMKKSAVAKRDQGTGTGRDNV